MDTEILAQELVRTLRGKRSQEAFARRLKCSANVVYSWEAGRRYPSASRFFEIVAASGVNLGSAFSQFLRVPVTPAEVAKGGLAAWLLTELRGNRSLTDVAKSTGKTRFRISRWFGGETEHAFRIYC